MTQVSPKQKGLSRNVDSLIPSIDPRPDSAATAPAISPAFGRHYVTSIPPRPNVIAVCATIGPVCLAQKAVLRSKHPHINARFVQLMRFSTTRTRPSDESPCVLQSQDKNKTRARAGRQLPAHFRQRAFRDEIAIVTGEAW